MLHGGKLNEAAGAGLGAEPLLLSVGGAAQGRRPHQPRCYDRELRREWVHRMLDHDGFGDEDGGIERWLILTDGLGLDRDYVISMKGALPATKFAVEAYVTFVREQPITVAVASSLTELFAPKIHKERISGMLENYRLHQRQGHGLLQAPPHAGAARRRLRPRVRAEERQDARRAGSLRRRRPLQMQRAVGAARRAAACLCRAGTFPPGAFRPEA